MQKIIRLLVITGLAVCMMFELAAPARATNGVKPFDLFDGNAAGHNWVNSYLLILASHYVFPVNLGVTDPLDDQAFKARFEDKFSAMGMKAFKYINIGNLHSDSQAVVMSNDDVVVVCFRGSESRDLGSFVRDWLTTDARGIQLDMPVFGSGVKVHKGFWLAFDVMKDKVNTAVKSLIKKPDGTNKRVWITGHSLGGALAQVAAMWFANIDKMTNGAGFKVQNVYTYGAPRVGNEAFRNRFEHFFNVRCQRWVNRNDIAPMLPDDGILGYRHIGITNNILMTGVVKLNDTEYRGVGDPGRHSTWLYAQSIRDNIPKELRDKMPAAPAGLAR